MFLLGNLGSGNFYVSLPEFFCLHGLIQFNGTFFFNLRDIMSEAMGEINWNK